MSAYLISQVEVLDAQAWENYRMRAARAIAQFGGRYLVRGALVRVIEADWPVEEPSRVSSDGRDVTRGARPPQVLGGTPSTIWVAVAASLRRSSRELPRRARAPRASIALTARRAPCSAE